MTLSMWILNSELSKKYDTIALIEKGELEIRSARAFTESGLSMYIRDCVYIGGVGDYFYGDAIRGTILAHGSDMIIVDSPDTLAVLNEVIAIFDKYHAFEERLERAGATEDPFQKVLDVIHDLFHCPMLFGRKDLRIFALTKQYTDDEVYPGWDDVKEFYTMPNRFIKTTLGPDMTAFPETISTAVIPVCTEEEKHFSYQIRALVYQNGQVWGHLYIYYYDKSVPMHILQLARFCADAYEALLDSLAARNEMGYLPKYTFLADMLDGKEIDKSKVENLSWHMSWNTKQKLRLYKISFERPLFFDFTVRLIDTSVDDEIMFTYKNSIVVIAKDIGRECSPLFNTIRRTLSDDTYVCGVSYPFDDLNMLSYAYYQADLALFIRARDKRFESNFAYYDDYPFSGLIFYLKQNINYRSFVMPELIEMYEADKKAGTEYYKTLFWMLTNNCQSTKTANQLFIHRNTLRYRLDKITNMLKVDIYDDDTRAYLRLCYSMMLTDYPIDDFKFTDYNGYKGHG